MKHTKCPATLVQLLHKGAGKGKTPKTPYLVKISWGEKAGFYFSTPWTTHQVVNKYVNWVFSVSS